MAASNMSIDASLTELAATTLYTATQYKSTPIFIWIILAVAHLSRPPPSNKKFSFQFWLLPSVLNCDYVGVPVQCYDGRSDDYPVCIESIYT